MSWVIGGFLCAIASIVTGLVKSPNPSERRPGTTWSGWNYWKPISQWNEEHGGRKIRQALETMPKSELHLHIEGTLEPELALTLASAME